MLIYTIWMNLEVIMICEKSQVNLITRRNYFFLSKINLLWQSFHKIICISTIMLYTLNLYSVVCQLFLSETGKISWVKKTTYDPISFAGNSTKSKTIVIENKSVVAWDQWSGRGWTRKGHEQFLVILGMKELFCMLIVVVAIQNIQ